MTRGRCIWLAILALCLAQALAAQCSNDSCLSAIRNAPTGNNATADCLSFLEEQAAPTGTLSGKTTTTTVTSTKRIATLTLHRLATITEQARKTNSNPEADKNGNHKRAEVEDGGVTGESQGDRTEAVLERRVTTSPASVAVPLYAKECASEADYSSACSCLGLSWITKAAAQPVSTKTVTAFRTIANVTLPPFFANSTRTAGNGTGTGGGTVSSTVYTGRTTSSTSSIRPTTLFTSRVTSSKGAGSPASTSISSSSKPSTTKSTVNVVTVTTLTTTKAPLWVNTTSTLSYSAGNTTIPYFTNSTTALPTVSANVTSSIWINTTTTSVRYPTAVNSTASWYNGSVTSTALAGTGTGAVKTSASTKLPIRYNTTASWYNGTSTSSLPLGTGTGHLILTTAPIAFPTSTSVRFPYPVNTTAYWGNGTATTAFPGRGTGTGTGFWGTGTGYYNTSTPTSTSTSASPTATEDLTCGETSTPFSLRVSQPGGTFDKWFVHVVGNGLLFTSSQERASSFSVEGTGHLCAVGYNDGNGKPRIAAVGVAGATDGDNEEEGRVEGEGPVMMLRQGTLKAYKDDYKALECTKDGGLSCKPANVTSTADGGGWVGCGVQLSMGRDIDLGYGGLNCTAVSLEVVEA
ncbi:hypothetical protein B0T20DRAFT_436220 [Sordaria brevicollis]|uniref:Uncharacterized protein n=1 Tax=Sordaria brevicollis TaxID=83679 RepID=A0AAE0PFU6_SORBR|nr:hypothetical protein B0T20DRAFT_436220 [Sordaria brevicollis]